MTPERLAEIRNAVEASKDPARRNDITQHNPVAFLFASSVYLTELLAHIDEQQDQLDRARGLIRTMHREQVDAWGGTPR